MWCVFRKEKGYVTKKACGDLQVTSYVAATLFPLSESPKVGMKGGGIIHMRLDAPAICLLEFSRLFLGLLPHLCRKSLYLRQVMPHPAPAVPESIVGVGMKCPLERPHAVFQEHDEEPLFDNRRGIEEREKIRICMYIFDRLLEYTVFV